MVRSVRPLRTSIRKLSTPDPSLSAHNLTSSQEGHPLYLKNMGIFEKIHSFFMGVPLAPYKVAEAIRDLAEEIEYYTLRKRGYRRPKGRGFVRELLELADVVDGGGFDSYSGTTGLGPRRALGFGHNRPRLGWSN